MTRNILPNDSLELKRLIDIIKPDNIISLGLDTSVVVIRTLIDEHFNGSTLTELIGDGKPYRYGDTNIYPMAYPEYWGTMNRGIENVKKDWTRMQDEWIEKELVRAKEN